MIRRKNSKILTPDMSSPESVYLMPTTRENINFDFDFKISNVMTLKLGEEENIYNTEGMGYTNTNLINEKGNAVELVNLNEQKPTVPQFPLTTMGKENLDFYFGTN